MSAWPETRDEVIAHFMRDDGFHPEYAIRKDRLFFEELVDKALTTPHPTFAYLGENNKPASPSQLVGLIHDRNLFSDDDTSGWVDREGRFISCSHAAHNFMIMLLGIEGGEVEAEMELGWIKVKPIGRPQLVWFKPNAKQLHTMKKMDFYFDRHVLIELHDFPGDKK